MTSYLIFWAYAVKSRSRAASPCVPMGPAVSSPIWFCIFGGCRSREAPSDATRAAFLDYYSNLGVLSLKFCDFASMLVCCIWLQISSIPGDRPSGPFSMTSVAPDLSVHAVVGKDGVAVAARFIVWACAPCCCAVCPKPQAA